MNKLFTLLFACSMMFFVACNSNTADSKCEEDCKKECCDKKECADDCEKECCTDKKEACAEGCEKECCKKAAEADSTTTDSATTGDNPEANACDGEGCEKECCTNS